MQHLLGLFESREQGMRAVEQLRAAGFPVRVIERPSQAGDAAEGTSEQAPTGTRAGGALGALGGGLLGAAPGAVVGTVLGRVLNEREVEAYEQTVAAGGVALEVEAPEIAPAAQAETMLREHGAQYVHTGEEPRAQ